MQRLNFASLCLLGFGANAIQMNVAQETEEYLEPEVGEFAQFATWFNGDEDLGEDMIYDKPVSVYYAQAQAGERSTSWNEAVSLIFNNASEETVQLFWHDYSGNLRSYGQLNPGQIMNMNTYATHPWSVTGNGEFMVDGDDVFVPGTADRNRRISIVKKNPLFQCNRQVNWMNNGPAYNQISLTDGCRNGICDANPRYASDRSTCNNEEAIAYCQDECERRESNGQGCEGFFFQKHGNGHEICGFYASGMENGQQVWGGHIAGAICEFRSFTYDLVESGDCIGNQLIQSAEECQDAIADVFGVIGAQVQTWNTSAYARGCFKHNYGHPGSAQAANAATTWVFNTQGGPGTSGHCTAEPGYAACICRE